MRKKLQDYLPPVLLKTYEFPLLCKTEQPEFDRLNAAATAVLDAQFVTTAGERGIARYEKIFKITPMDTDTLDAGENQCTAAVLGAPSAAAVIDLVRRGRLQDGD